MKKQYPMIDISKFICALLVVFIHSYETPRDNIVLQVISKCFTRQAVPFFFIASGFFFGKKIYDSKDQIKTTFSYCRKMIMLYIIWELLWMPYYIVFYINRYGANMYTALVLFRRYVFAGNGVYWYLLALTEAALVAGFLIRYGKEKILYFLAAVGFILCMMYNINLVNTIVNQVFYFVFSWSNNFIMMGIPYFTIGVVLSRREIDTKQSYLCIGYLIISILNVVIYLKTNNDTLAIFYPLQAILLFIYSKNNKMKLNGIIFRELSSAIFYLHTIFIYTFIDEYLGFGANDIIRWGTAVALSIISYYIIKKVNIKPLKYLISAK